MLFPLCLARRRPPLRLARPPALGLALSLLIHAGQALAQGPVPQTVHVAARVPVAADRLAADVVVLDARRIQASASGSLADLLQQEAGLQVSRNGGPGQSTALFVRGAGAANTLVLVDGVRVGSATLGYADFAALGLLQIERIEVLRGPASSLYGADAVGGVVLITTRRGEPGLQLGGLVAVGGYGASEAGLSVAGAQGAWDYAASFSREAADGRSALRAGDQFGNFNPDDDGFARRSLHLQAGLQLAPGHRLRASLLDSRLDSQYDASEYLAPSYSQNAMVDFRSRLDTRVLSLDYDGRLGTDWTLRASGARSEDDTRSGGSLVSRFDTRREQALLQLGWSPAAGQQWVLAADHLREQADASDYNARVGRHNTGLVLAYVGQFDALTLQADMRHDSNSVYGGQHTGRLGASWTLAPGLRLRALTGNTFHAPSFNDLYYPGYGVASVQAERGRSSELGLSWQQGRRALTATLWRNRVRDLIAYEPDNTLCPNDPAYSFGCARNVGRARLSGLTLSGQTAWQDLQLRGEYNYLEAHDGLTGEWLPRRSRHQLSLSAEWQQGTWTWAATTVHGSARPDQGVTLRGRQTLDLSARWQLARDWQLQAKLLNATNTDLEPVRDYQGLGRQAWVGLRYQHAGP